MNEYLEKQMKYVTEIDQDTIDYYGPNNLPTERSIENARSILQMFLLRGVDLSKVAIRCSGAGGVVIAFNEKPKYCSIECLNDGEVWFFQKGYDEEEKENDVNSQ